MSNHIIWGGVALFIFPNQQKEWNSGVACLMLPMRQQIVPMHAKYPLSFH